MKISKLESVFTKVSSIYILFVIFIPSYIYVYNKPGIPLISASRLYIFFWEVCALIGLLIVPSKYRKSKPKKYGNYPFRNTVVILLVTLLISSLFSENKSLSFQNFISLNAENFIPSYLIWISYEKSVEIIRKFKILVFIFVIFTLYGCVSYFISFNPINELVNSIFPSEGREIFYTYDDKIRAGSFGRAQSIFYHSLQYGCYVCMVLCILFWLSRTRAYSNLLIPIAFAFLFLLSIYTTKGRSPILFLFVSAFTYWFFSGYVLKLKTLVLSGFLTSIVALFLIPNVSENQYVLLLYSIVLEFFTGEQLISGTSFASRMAQLDRALLYFFLKPVSGHGLSAIREMPVDPYLGTSQSFLFTVLIECGIAGLVGYSIFYGHLISLYFKNARMSVNLLSKELSITILAVIMGYIVFIMATGNMQTFSVFFVLVTMASKILYLEKLRHFSVPPRAIRL